MSYPKSNYEKFVTTMVKVHGVSIEYADAEWYTLSDNARKHPVEVATDFFKLK